MIFRMSRRERILMVATIAIGGGFLLYQLGINRIVTSLSNTSAQLAEAKATFMEYVKQQERKEIIERQYSGIEDQFSPLEPGKKPAQQFSERVAALCAELDFKFPNIAPPRDEEVEGVDEYKFITLTIKLDGTIESIAKLLKGLDSHSLLIKELSLRSVMDSDKIRAEIDVARITRVSEEELKAKREKRERKPRRGTTRFHI